MTKQRSLNETSDRLNRRFLSGGSMVEIDLTAKYGGNHLLLSAKHVSHIQFFLGFVPPLRGGMEG